MLLFAAGAISPGMQAFAQGKVTVSGVVSDNLGPVPGAGVVVKKTTEGAVTDIDCVVDFSHHSVTADLLRWR